MNYLIWSNEHGKWWGPYCSGYTAVIEAAGRYPKDMAIHICRQANYSTVVNEVMVPEPESFAELVDAVADAVIQFRIYQDHHVAKFEALKSDPDSDPGLSGASLSKAEVNRKFADQLEALLR